MNKKQKEAVKNAINKCRFPVIWDDTNKQRYIEVPSDYIDIWNDCMFASYLHKEFNFSIQQVIPGSVIVKDIFNPDMSRSAVREEGIKEDVRQATIKRIDQLAVDNTYIVRTLNDPNFETEHRLLRIIKNSSAPYAWSNENGNTFQNREQDIKQWIFFNAIRLKV